MKKYFILILVFSLCSGCAYLKEYETRQQNFRNAVGYKTNFTGATQQQIYEEFGKPHYSSTMYNEFIGTTEHWSYTYYPDDYGLSGRKHIISITFTNGKVTSVSYY